MIAFFVPGVPKASQTGSIVRLPNGRAFPSRRNTAWGEVVGLVARQYAPPKPLSGPLSVELDYVFARPRSVSARTRPAPDVRPDLDNCLKHQLDTLCGVLWHDDAQIVDLRVRKLYGSNPGLHVAVKAWLPAVQAALTFAAIEDGR